MADGSWECCALCAGGEARDALERELERRQDPETLRLGETRIKATLEDASSVLIQDLQHRLDRRIPDDLLLGVVGPLVDRAESTVFRTEALLPHSLAELFEAYATELDAAADRWYERLRPQLLAVIESALPDLETELESVLAGFAASHTGLVRG